MWNKKFSQEDLATLFFKEKIVSCKRKSFLRFKLFKYFQGSAQKQSTDAIIPTKEKSRLDDRCLFQSHRSQGQ